MESDKKIRVAFYLRVSTDEQARDWFGLDMQLNGLEEMMNYRHKNHNFEHNPEWRYVDDWYSGWDLNRPGFQRMIEDAKKGKFDLIAVWKIDRLSRNLSHLLSSFETLQKYQVWFFSVKENIDFTGPIWKLTFQIFGALAEFERETIRMRTKEWKNASARRWNYIIGTAPYGYKKIELKWNVTKGIEIIDDEAIWVRKIFDECIAWNTLEGIAKMMNEYSVLKWYWSTKKNKNTKWYSTWIREMLEDTTYIGIAVYNPLNEKWEISPIEIPVPGIINPLIFEMAQKALEQISLNTQRWWGEKSYLLSRLIFDNETQRNFIWVERTKGWHSYRRKGFELDGIKYANREIPWKALDEHIWNQILKLLDRPEELFEIYQKQNLDKADYEELLKKRRKIDNKLEELRGEELTIEKRSIRWDYSDEIRNELINDNKKTQIRYQKDIKELDEKLDAIVQAEMTKDALMKFSEHFDMNLKKIAEVQKRRLIEILIERIEVTFKDADYYLKVKFRFDQDKAKQKSMKTNQKSSLLTDNLSKESWNYEPWWGIILR